MQNFLSLWLNAGAQITHGGQVHITYNVNDYDFVSNSLGIRSMKALHLATTATKTNFQTK